MGVTFNSEEWEETENPAPAAKTIIGQESSPDFGTVTHYDDGTHEAEPPAPIHTDADEVAEEEACIIAENAKGDDTEADKVKLMDGPWSREITFNVVESAEGLKFCKACLENSPANECWVVLPGIGTCEECGAENVRQYIVEVESERKPLCLKYKPDALCAYIETLCVVAECCQLCERVKCGHRCEPARGLDEEGSNAAQ